MSTRTWVSGVGDDVNPGSRTAPCKTFAGAISKTDPGGEIDVIDPGGFGTLTIVKSVTIDGQGTFASILGSGTNGINVNVVGGIVTLRNLSINGEGTGINGIHLLNAAVLCIENCVISGFSQQGILLDPASASCRVFIKDTIIRNNGPVSGGGVVIKPGASGAVNAVLDNVSLIGNVVGVNVADRGTASIRNCVVMGNANAGIAANNANAALTRIQVDHCLVAENNANPAATTGILSSGAQAVVLISDCTVFQNGIGLATAGGGVLASYGNNRLFNNITSNGSAIPSQLQ